MMTKTTLSDGRRTRPRFAGATPTPPKFLIGTDDPARIGILSDQRESKGFGWDPAKTLRMAEPPEFLIGTDDPARIGILSDQREPKGFGWDPAKTLRMAEPPEFLIGTFQQSKNHSNPSKQTTNPNPNNNETRVSRPPQRIGDSPWRFVTPAISRPTPFFGLVPFAQPHPRKPSELSQSLVFTP